VGYCIAHNPLLLQPLRHWFTFIFRKYEHLAVEDFIIKDLPDSRGSRLWLPPCIPHLYPYCITLLRVCQEVFEISFKGLFLLGAPSPLVSCGLLLTSLTLYHNLGDLSRGFLFFSRFLFAPKFLRVVSYPHPKVETLGSVISPLDIISIPQTTQKVKNFFQKIFELAPANSAPGESPPVVDVRLSQ
jgi:hypothetical protein